MTVERLKGNVYFVVFWSTFFLLAETGEILRPCQAQLFSFEGAKTYDIQADGTLEWHQEEGIYVARENVRLQVQETTLKADLIAVYSRQDPQPQFYSFVLEGNVKISNRDYTLEGQRGQYDADSGLFILTGTQLRLVSEAIVITATESFEFYETKNLFVVRGAPFVQHKDRYLKANVIAGRVVVLESNEQPTIERLDAVGEVELVTEKGRVSCDRLMYSFLAERVILQGNVVLFRGQDYLQGPKAEIDFKSGKTRILGSENTPVQAIFNRNNINPSF